MQKFPQDTYYLNHLTRADCNSTDVKVKVEAATQLRDNLEHYISGPIYPAFLKKLVPIFINCLKGPPVFVSTSAEQVSILHPGHGGVRY